MYINKLSSKSSEDNLKIAQIIKISQFLINQNKNDVRKKKYKPYEVSTTHRQELGEMK